MKLKRNSSLIVAAFVLVGLCAREAAAQAPTVTFQQNGAQVRVEWTPIAGATFYEVFVTGSVSGGPISLPTTFFVVTPPPGTYNLQVRGTNGTTAGPLSAPVTITVGAASPGGGGCGPVDAPALTVSASGFTVNVSWGAVAGAIGYRLQVGTSPGATQFQVDLPASQTAYANSVPFLGIYYVRVIAANACGAFAPSAEQSVTIGAATPGPAPGPSVGPRTADPPAGQLIPRATLGYLQGVVIQAAAQFAGDLFNSCTTAGGNHNFMYRLVSRLRQIDTRWAMNDKRGQRGDISHDIVAYNPTNRPDDGESQIYLFDVISGHCGSNPGPNWADVTDVTWAARGNPACGTEWCARWTLDRYRQAGFAP
jgi:hypothetical protein